MTRPKQAGKRVNARLAPALHKALCDEAERRGITVADLLRLILGEWMQRVLRGKRDG